MKAEDFYSILRDYAPFFKEQGLAKHSRNRYDLPDSIRMQFVLEKWGWIPGEGARFLVRLSDHTRVVDTLGNILPEDQYDITPYRLKRQGALDGSTINYLCDDQPAAVRKSLDGGPWFQYYDEHHLRKLLDKLLPAIFQEMKRWIAARPEARKIPPRIVRMTPEQIEKIKEDIKSMRMGKP